MQKPILIALVDVAHIFRALWHAGEHKELSFAYSETLARVQRIVDKGYGRVVCCIDAPPYKRTEFYPEYKAGRAEMSLEFKEQYKDTQVALRKLGCIVWKAKGFEADDIIATAVRHASKAKIGCHIYTGDKDLLQLVSDPDDVRVISPNDHSKSLDEQGVLEKMGIYPHQVVDFLALSGDRSDNIPGCPQCGPATAKKMLSTGSTLEEILAISADGGAPVGASAVVARNLNSKAIRRDVFASKTLVELMDTVPIVWDEIYEEPKMESNLESNETDLPEDTYTAPETEPPDTREEPTLVESPTPEPETEPPDTREEREDPEASPAPIVRAAPRPPAQATLVDAIEIRPGVYMTGHKFSLMKNLATVFDNSGLYRRLNGAAGIFAVMELGLELGMSPSLACQSFHVIEGKPSPAAHLLIALAKGHPDCVYLDCVTDTSSECVYVTKKKSSNRELTFSYTMEEARQAGMKGGNWDKRPREMLRKTCGSQAARLWYPDATVGLYSMEELGELGE